MELERETDLIPFLLLLLLVGNPSGLSLAVLDLLEVHSDGAVPEGVGVGGAPMLLEGGPEAADEGVKAAPGLLEGAGAGRRWVRLAEVGAAMQVNLSLSELVEVSEEVDDVAAAALVHRDRRLLVFQVLTESVPVSSLLRLVPAQERRRRRRRRLQSG